MSVVQELREISADLTLTFEERLARLLDMGCRLLGAELGILSHIENDRYTVVKAVSQSDEIADGAVFPLGETYCADTIGSDDIVAYHNIDAHPGTLHPCYDKFPLKSYIAVAVSVNLSNYGTLSFSSTQPRPDPYSDIEYDYLVLLAEWLGTEVSRKLAMETLLNNQQQLSEQNVLFRQVNELTGVGTWQVSIATGEVIWSASLKKIFGLDASATITIDTVLSFIKDPDIRAYYHRTFIEKAQKGEDWTFEFEAATTDGERRWVETRSHPLMEKGCCKRVIGATQEVTERVETNLKLKKESEVAAEALAARSMFLANMSHEIRTPIHGVQGMLEALGNTALSSKQLEFCDIAKQSAETLLNIVNDVLDFSKIDAGHMRYVSRPLNMSHLINKQIAMFRQMMDAKGLKLELDLDSTTDVMLLGDSMRISQIMLNLISNAIKFTQKGTISIATRLLPQRGGDYLVRIRVSDTGIGIAQRRQHAIFRPFEQGDEAITRHFGGTGLGLSIVAQIAEHYNGGVKVESELGQGTCFSVTLQLTAADKASPQPIPDRRRTARTDSLASLSVLVIEDNEINRVVIREQLNTLGINADFAENGELGVNALRASVAKGAHYDIVLMDCQMPVMDGYEATRAIRQLGLAEDVLPIIALTANAMADEREKCLKAGMNDYLTKPLSVERLTACLRDQLAAPQKTA